MNRGIIAHYDRLIEMDNDPARDPQLLREYMDKWDGAAFMDLLALDESLSVLEIGVGTGRLAMRIAPECGKFCGMDVSAKSIERAKENLSAYCNVDLLCDDFLAHAFTERFDVICSSLTFMHILRKQEEVSKIAALLNPGGRAVISIDKNQQPFIDAGFGKLEIYPDDPQRLAQCLCTAGLKVEACVETEFAFILSAINKSSEC